MGRDRTDLLCYSSGWDTRAHIYSEIDYFGRHMATVKWDYPVIQVPRCVSGHLGTTPGKNQNVTSSKTKSI